MGRKRKIPLDDDGTLKVGDEVYTCSPPISEGSGAPIKPQLTKITNIIERKTKVNTLVLEDKSGYTYYEVEKNCSKDEEIVNEIYQKQRKMYGAGLLQDCLEFVDDVKLRGEITKIREQLIDENGATNAN